MAATVTPASVRLRRSDCSGTGISPRQARARLPLPRRRRRARARRRGARAHPRAGHPAGVEGRVDLPVPRRPHPGDRHRRGRAQAVPLPPALARAARHREVRRHGGLRPHAAAAARARRRRPRARGPVLRPRLRDRRAAARPRLLPRRRRGLRRPQRDLRPGHDAEEARAPPGRGAVLRLPGQARQAPHPGRDRPRGRRRRRPPQAPPRRRRRAARLQARAHAGRTSSRPTSTPG